MNCFTLSQNSWQELSTQLKLTECAFTSLILGMYEWLYVHKFHFASEIGLSSEVVVRRCGLRLKRGQRNAPSASKLESAVNALRLADSLTRPLSTH